MKQVIQLILIMLVGTDVCFRVRENPPVLTW